MDPFFITVDDEEFYPSEACSAEPDLWITKSNGISTIIPGAPITYTIVAGNDGPSAGEPVSVTDVFPAELACNWSSLAAGGASGNSNGSDDIGETLVMPSGSTVTNTVLCNLDPAATGTLINTATISSPAIDPDSSNNTATDIDQINVIFADGFESGAEKGSE